MSENGRRIPLAVALGVGAAAGALTALQSRINGELGVRLDDGYVAAVISFGSGLALVLFALAFSRRGRTGVGNVVAALRSGTLRWWMLLGGLAGASFVLSQGLTAALLGVALFTIGVVGGQTVAALLVDKFGLGPSGAHALTRSRIFASALAILAVVVAVVPRLGDTTHLIAVLFPMAAGASVSWQQAVNGRVRVSAESALTATLGNFIVGTTALVIAMLVHVTGSGWPTDFPHEPWLYFGGMIGVIFIAVSALLVRRTGVLLLGLSMLAGQLIAAVLLDLISPIPGTTVSAWTVTGALLALVAVAIAGVRHTTPQAHTAAV